MAPDSTQSAGATAARSPSAPVRLPAVWLAAGLIPLLVAGGAMGMLVYAHLRGVALPGCGAGSPCDEAARSAWGRVPGLGWPVSHVGLAYFLAMAAAWLAVRGTAWAALRWMARAGAAASLIYVFVLIVGGYHCWYCLAAHLGNFAFWLVLEVAAGRGSRAAAAASWRPDRFASGASAAMVAPLVFLLATGALVAAERTTQRRAAEKAEQELAASTAQMIAEASRPESAAQPAGRRFTGRYRLGPEVALARIVAFIDYQCPTCKELEAQVEELLAKRSDVSFSPRHYPLNRECNPGAEHKHSQACRCARAVEAAGLLHGEAGFWRMHRWLFEQGGKAHDNVLAERLRKWGWDETVFQAAMHSPDVAERIEADVADARSLAVFSTPTVFINGVELRGWNAPQALERAVEQLAARNVQPASAEQEVVQSPAVKLVADWLAIPTRTVPPKPRPWWRGASDATVRVVLFGDYLDATTAEADRLIREAQATRPAVQYAFRHVPVHPDCNPTIKTARHALSCRAAWAAEAAGLLGGPHGYWRMHDWLFEHQPTFNDDLLHAGAAEQGIDPAALFAAMESKDVRDAVSGDALSARRLGVDRVPVIFVNDRWLVRWKAEGLDAIGPILDAAAVGVDAAGVTPAPSSNHDAAQPTDAAGR